MNEVSASVRRGSGPNVSQARNVSDGDQEDGRHEGLADPVGEPLDRRLRPLGVLDEGDDPGQRRVGADPRRAQHERAAAVDGRPEHRVAGRLVDRDRLAGQHRFVDASSRRRRRPRRPARDRPAGPGGDRRARRPRARRPARRPPRSRRAFVACSPTRRRIAPPARVFARASSQRPSRTSPITTIELSKYVSGWRPASWTQSGQIVTATLYAQAAVVPTATSVSIVGAAVPGGPPRRAVEAAAGPGLDDRRGNEDEAVDRLHAIDVCGQSIRAMIPTADGQRDDGLDAGAAAAAAARSRSSASNGGAHRPPGGGLLRGRRRLQLVAGGLDRPGELGPAGHVGQVADRRRLRGEVDGRGLDAVALAGGTARSGSRTRRRSSRRWAGRSRRQGTRAIPYSPGVYLTRRRVRRNVPRRGGPQWRRAPTVRRGRRTRSRPARRRARGDGRPRRDAVRGGVLELVGRPNTLAHELARERGEVPVVRRVQDEHGTRQRRR